MADEDPFFSPQQIQHAQHHDHQPHIYRPVPRRNFVPNSHARLTDALDAREHDAPDTPPEDEPDPDPDGGFEDFAAQLNARLLRTRNTSNASAGTYEDEDEAARAQDTRNKSYINMTRGALFGIYDEVGTGTTGDSSLADTPWGTGAETPALSPAMDAEYYFGASGFENGLGSPDAGLRMKDIARRGTRDARLQRTMARRPASKAQRHGVARLAVVAGKLCSLFLFGAVYGVIVSHLHDSRELAAVQVGGVDTESWMYLAGWGLAGLTLGSLLPYVDLMYGGRRPGAGSSRMPLTSAGSQWFEVVRSVGTFVGIAFAIRRLPWQSTLQLTVTLALVNPALWYILDRSRNGLSFSLITTSILTSCIFLSNPAVLPSPALPATVKANATSMPSASARTGSPPAYHQAELFAGMVSYENLATATWVGSVIFCSCICFGGIGRRLAVLDEWEGEK